jgi:hypothetical protein
MFCVRYVVKIASYIGLNDSAYVPFNFTPYLLASYMCNFSYVFNV